MKPLSVLLAALLALPFICGTAQAQDLPETENYRLSVQVVDKKGRPFNSVNVVASVDGREEAHKMPSNGIIFIPGVKADDVLNIIAGTRMFQIPVNGYDSLNVVFNNPRKLKGVYNKKTEEMANFGYGTVSLKSNTEALAVVDMSTIEHYTTLLDYLKGRVAGLEVVGNTVRIRGVNSINSGTEPLVVVDGTALALGVANTTISPRDIESITVDKTGSMYGVRGSNGVIIITTRRGAK